MVRRTKGLEGLGFQGNEWWSGGISPWGKCKMHKFTRDMNSCAVAQRSKRPIGKVASCQGDECIDGLESHLVSGLSDPRRKWLRGSNNPWGK